MPYKTVWSSADEFFAHRGVMIYHQHPEDDIDEGHRTHWFGTHEDVSSGSEHMQGGAFDVRQLPNPNRHDVDTDEGRKNIIREAIDAGELLDENNAPIVPQALGLGNLTDEQADALGELVHEQASELAANANNSGEGVEFLLANGWTREEIISRLAEMVLPTQEDR